MPVKPRSGSCLSGGPLRGQADTEERQSEALVQGDTSTLLPMPRATPPPLTHVAGLVERTSGQIKPHHVCRASLSLGGVVKDQSGLPASSWGGQGAPGQCYFPSHPRAHFPLLMDPLFLAVASSPGDVPQTCMWEEDTGCWKPPTHFFLCGPRTGPDRGCVVCPMVSCCQLWGNWWAVWSRRALLGCPANERVLAPPV